MREENRKDTRKNLNIIKTKRISIIGFVVATILLTLAVFLAMREEKAEREASLNNNIKIDTTISTNSKMGKNINEVKKESILNETNNQNENSTLTTSSSNKDKNNNVEIENNLNSENEKNENKDAENEQNANNENIQENTIEIPNNQNNENKKENETTATYTKPVSTNEIQQNETNNNDKKEVNTNENNTKENKSEFIKPIDGDTLKIYSMDSLIYSETLQEWTTHRGIDIKADKGADVKCIADGTIKSIKTDPRYGISVIIKHNNGFESVYACLLNEAQGLKEGDKVIQGQTIGNIGNSGVFEVTEGMHLHFEMLKDGEYVNPDIYIK